MIDRFVDGAGVLSILPREFPDVITMLRDRCGERPMLLAGMIGSNRGWIEAPYVDCPTTIDRLAARIVAVDGRDIHIIPGVCDRSLGRADAMRGEEVQVLGALAAGLIGPDMQTCHPGTHAKWARLEQGALAACKTVMTGGMFAMLSRHSLLAGPLKGKATPNAAFQEGSGSCWTGASCWRISSPYAPLRSWARSRRKTCLRSAAACSCARTLQSGWASLGVARSR